MSPPEPGNNTAIACGFCGRLVRKYDCVTLGRVESVTISCAPKAPDAETSKNTHAKRLFRRFEIIGLRVRATPVLTVGQTPRSTPTALLRFVLALRSLLLRHRGIRDIDVDA